MAQTVIGIFDSASEAQTALQHLVSNGFSRDSIDISARSSSDTVGSSRDAYNENDSVGDRISHFFSNLFGDDDSSRGYSEVARRGTIVTIHAQSLDEAERAAQILDQYGAVDVDERAANYRNNLSGTDTANFGTASVGTAVTDTLNTSDRVDDTTEGRTSIPIIEEQLNVGKQVVETGGVRMRSRIVERPVEESLRLREERVFVERNAVNRPASEADLDNFQQGVVEMTERSEVPFVSKEARVVEEITLGKEVEEREETVRDTVRKTEVDVQNLKKDDLRTDNLRTDNLRNDDLDADRRLDDDDYNRPANL